MRYQFDYAILDAINNAVRTVKAAPLMLGATSSGFGGPPGGFVGYLPQGRVSFDPDELSEWPIPESGITLLTNLNRIRYRLDAIESGGSGSGASTFLDLLDTPSTYSGYAGKALVVTEDETGIEFITISGGSGVLPTFDGGRVVVTDALGNITVVGGLRYDPTYNCFIVGDHARKFAGTGDIEQFAPDGENPTHSINTWGGVPARIIWVAGGTEASPTAVASGQVLDQASIVYAWDGFNYLPVGRIRARATEDHDGTSHGMVWEVMLKPADDGAEVVVATISNAGMNIPSGTYNVGGSPHTHTGGGGAFQRNLTSNLTLADGECLVLVEYLNQNTYDITLDGDADLVIL